MTEKARSYYGDLDFDIEDLTQLSYKNNSYDVVLLSGVLGHISNYKKTISEACCVSYSCMILHRCPI